MEGKRLNSICKRSFKGLSAGFINKSSKSLSLNSLISSKVKLEAVNSLMYFFSVLRETPHAYELIKSKSPSLDVLIMNKKVYYPVYLKYQKFNGQLFESDFESAWDIQDCLIYLEIIKESIGSIQNGSLYKLIPKTIEDLDHIFKMNNLPIYTPEELKEAIDKNLMEEAEFNQKHFGIKEEPKKGCFIATATMGDYNHPIVLDLRLFRDSWLLKRTWGVNFTNWYYKNSPNAAKFIEQNVMLRNLTFYILIKPLHFISKKSK